MSFDEQQDLLPPPPVGEPDGWLVIGLALSPLLVIGVVSLVATAIINWK